MTATIRLDDDRMPDLTIYASSYNLRFTKTFDAWEAEGDREDIDAFVTDYNLQEVTEYDI